MNRRTALARCLLLGLLGLLGLSGPVAAASGVIIELRPEVSAAGPMVTLGQLARLQSTDLATLRQLVDLPVGRAPLHGASILLEREALAAWLRRRLGRAAEQAEWRGSPASRVSLHTRTLDGEEVGAAASQALGAWLAARSDRSEVHMTVAPRDIAVPQGPSRLQVRVPGRSRPRSRMTMWVEVWVAERFIRLVPVTFAVEAWADSWVTAVALPAGALLPPAAAQRREIDLTSDAPTLLPAAGALRVRQSMASGDPLRPQDLEPVPAVVRGQWASLWSGSGAVSSESRVQVLQDGRVGDSVRVRPSAATGSVLARVRSPGQLEVAR